MQREPSIYDAKIIEEYGGTTFKKVTKTNLFFFYKKIILEYKIIH